MQTTRETIESGWRVRELIPGTMEPGKVDWIAARIPGHVHLDLIRAGVIADPFYRMQERACAWVDEADWEYETTFEVPDPAPPHAYLKFHGLDTIAEIYLNGSLLAETDNMFIEHEFPVGTENSADPGVPALRPGDNVLRVIFRSALRIGRERQQAFIESHPPAEAHANPHPFVWGPRSFVRKAQYMYGWDWGPELVSCGIWKPVELVVAPAAEIVNWSYDVDMPIENPAWVNFTFTVRRTASESDVPLRLAAKIFEAGTTPGGRPDIQVDSADVPTGPGSHVCSLRLAVPDPVLWARDAKDGSEDAPVYHFRAFVKAGKELLDELSSSLGIRTINLESDAAEGTFRFLINGLPAFMNGANWIPIHSFPSTGPENSCEWSRSNWYLWLAAARPAGINMLRVWGGGLYESDEFYDLCDEHGILVWQDFPYACAYYPDTEEYAAKAEAEARAAVRRLRNHPSLAVWCGNNECHQVWHDHWEGKENPSPRFLGERLYHEILPRVVAEEDPGRPYWPGSPFGGENPNSEDEGDRHNWNVWHGAGDWIHYQQDQGRFISEFGFASSCGLNAWDKCLAEPDKHPYSPVVRWHDKTRKGYENYLELVKLHFPEPVTLEDLVYYTQLNQAEALKCGIEHWRRNKGRCWGTLFWQLNDCWPVQSWSIIDSEMEPKAAYYAVKRIYAPVLLSLLRNGDFVEAHLTSDLREHIQGDITVSVESFDGEVLMDQKFEAYVEENGTTHIGSLDISAFNLHARSVYVYARFEPYWDAGIPKVENFLFLAEPKDLSLPNPGLTAEIRETEDSPSLALSAARFAPYVWWRFDGLRSPFSGDNHFHLRAGQTRIIPLKEMEESLVELRSRLRIRSL